MLQLIASLYVVEVSRKKAFLGVMSATGSSCLPTWNRERACCMGYSCISIQPLSWLAPCRIHFSSAHAGEPNRETAVTGYKPSLDWSRAWRQRLLLSVGGIFWSQCMRMYCPLQAEQLSVNWVLSRQSASTLDVGRIPQTATVCLPTRRKKPKHTKIRNLDCQDYGYWTFGSTKCRRREENCCHQQQVKQAEYGDFYPSLDPPIRCWHAKGEGFHLHLARLKRDERTMWELLSGTHCSRKPPLANISRRDS